MRAPGPLLAVGRSADIFEYGPGLVLRRSREGQTMQDEARLMEHVRAHGYPVPAVQEVSDDGLSMVMERIDGVHMVAAIGKRPWTIPRAGRQLADLHTRLHRLPAPDWLSPAPVGTGDHILHLDLHPLNVIMSPSGPVVIDWTGGSRGDPAVDVAISWVLMATGSVATGPIIGAVLGRARRALVASFLAGLDTDAVRPQLRPVVAWKVEDPHMSADEQRRMWQLVGHAGGEQRDG